MQVSVTFRNTESKEVLREYVQEKISKLNKYLDNPLEASVILSVEKHRHIAEVNLIANRVAINAQEETEDMFSAIDRVMDKLERQILKYKERIKHHKMVPNVPEETGNPGAPALEEGTEPRLIKSKKITAKPMTAEEAAMQMELLKYDFWVFTNADSKHLNIIYRLKDGNYGLIEPQLS